MTCLSQRVFLTLTCRRAQIQRSDPIACNCVDSQVEGVQSVDYVRGLADHAFGALALCIVVRRTEIGWGGVSWVVIKIVCPQSPKRYV